MIIPECFARKSRFSLLKNLFSLALDSSILPVYLCPSLSLLIPSLLLFSVSRPISQSFSFCFLILNKYERYLYFQADTLLDTLFSIFFPLISLFLHPQSFPTKNSYFSKNHVLLHCKPILPNTMCFYTARIFLPSLLFL